MTRFTVATLGVLALCLGLSPSRPAAQGAVAAQARPTTPKPAASHVVDPDIAKAAAQTALVKQYCVTCHNDRAKAGTLSLASFDAANAADHAETAEKMIRKLRAGM